jgi:hypothetical protein
MNPFRWLINRVKTSLQYVIRKEFDAGMNRGLREIIHEEFDAGMNRWLRDIDFGLRLRAILDSASFVQENIPLHKRFDPLALRQRALELAPKDGLLMEFGVWKGMWINRIASWTDRQVYGFDSFEGLPEPWSFRPKGFFEVDTAPEVRRNVTLVKGKVNDSLPLFLREHPEHVAFIHRECELYSSARTVLELIKDRLVSGTTIVLDDFLMEPGWQCQEHKAWLDFAQINKVEFEYFGYQTNIACAVGVQITKAPTRAG